MTESTVFRLLDEKINCLVINTCYNKQFKLSQRARLINYVELIPNY